MSDEKEATAAEIEAVISPETHPDSVLVGGKAVSIRPLARRWQSLFFQAALPLFEAEVRPAETMIKAFKDGSYAFTNLAKEILDAEIDADKHLDRAAGIILASQIPGGEKDPEKTIGDQVDWLGTHARTEELRKLVEAQAEIERIVERVGERLPVRFARLFHLAGEKQITVDSLKQLLTSWSRRLQEPTPGGDSA